MKNKYEIINYLIEKYGYESYVEIGVDNPHNNFLKINCKLKFSVDPYFDMLGNKTNKNDQYLNYITHNMTSDEFFSLLDKNQKFDIIFIDGFHYDKQVYKDLTNSLNHLSSNGIIVMHDNLPEIEIHQSFPCKCPGQAWTGNVWKVLPELGEKFNLKYNVIDTDWGVGIVKYQKLNIPESYIYESNKTWNDFVSNKNELMHIITIDLFLLKY